MSEYNPEDIFPAAFGEVDGSYNCSVAWISHHKTLEHIESPGRGQQGGDEVAVRMNLIL